MARDLTKWMPRRMLSARFDPAGALLSRANLGREDRMVELAPLTAMLVGSYPQPSWLAERTGAMPPIRFRDLGDTRDEACDDAVRLAVLDQVEAGLGVIGDGEQDRVSYQDYFMRRMEGLSLYPETRALGAPVESGAPRVVGALSLSESVAAPMVAKVRRSTNLPIKLSVIGPFTIGTRMVDTYYGDRERLGNALADVLNGELRAIQAAGCDILQIDEPGFTARLHDPETIQWGVSLVNRVLEGITVPVVMHMCFGYAIVVKEKDENKAGSAYHAVLPYLRDARPDILSLELAQPHADMEVLQHAEGKKFLLGLLDLSTNNIEAPEQIAARIREAARYAPLESLYTGPDCGMKFLPREVAKAKLEVLTAGARLVLS